MQPDSQQCSWKKRIAVFVGLLLAVIVLMYQWWLAPQRQALKRAQQLLLADTQHAKQLTDALKHESQRRTPINHAQIKRRSALWSNTHLTQQLLVLAHQYQVSIKQLQRVERRFSVTAIGNFDGLLQWLYRLTQLPVVAQLHQLVFTRQQQELQLSLQLGVWRNAS